MDAEAQSISITGAGVMLSDTDVSGRHLTVEAQRRGL